MENSIFSYSKWMMFHYFSRYSVTSLTLAQYFLTEGPFASNQAIYHSPSSSFDLAKFDSSTQQLLELILSFFSETFRLKVTRNNTKAVRDQRPKYLAIPSTP